MAINFKIDLSKVARCLRVCYRLNMPVIVWGLSGWGKSSVVRQSVPPDFKYYKFILATKEAPEVGGIPFPTEPEKKTGNRWVDYLMHKTLPFDCEEWAIINFDEIDRVTDTSVFNAFQELWYEGGINGHKLSPYSRRVGTANGMTDSGTMAITDALAGRACHIYVETEGEGPLNSWLGWARSNNVSNHLQSFAKYNSEVWHEYKGQGELVELGLCKPRTAVEADKIFFECKKIEQEKLFPTSDIVLPLMGGWVSWASAQKMIGWYEVCESAPTIEEITKSPKTCRLPDTFGVYYALGNTIAKKAKAMTNGHIDSIATYIARWPREAAKMAFEQATTEQPKLAASPSYLQWENSR